MYSSQESRQLEKLSAIVWTGTAKSWNKPFTHITLRTGAFGRVDFLPHILILNPEYLLSSLWVPVFSTTYLLPRGSQYLFTLHQMIGWENNRDCDITTPLSLETIEVQIKKKRFRTVQVNRTKEWHSTYPIGDDLLSRSAGRSFVPLQKLRRNHLCYVWTKVLSDMVFVST